TGPSRRNAATSAASSASGAMPFAQAGTERAGRVRRSNATPARSSDTRRLPHVQDPHPPELRELALMRVEHERARMVVRELQHRQSALAPQYGARPIAPLQVRTRAVEPEEVAVQVERVDQVEFRHVDQVDPVQLAQPDGDRMALVMEGDGVDSVHLVLVVEV